MGVKRNQNVDLSGRIPNSYSLFGTFANAGTRESHYL